MKDKREKISFKNYQKEKVMFGKKNTIFNEGINPRYPISD